jgi:hypothetical protein
MYKWRQRAQSVLPGWIANYPPMDPYQQHATNYHGYDTQLRRDELQQLRQWRRNNNIINECRAVCFVGMRDRSRVRKRDAHSQHLLREPADSVSDYQPLRGRQSVYPRYSPRDCHQSSYEKPIDLSEKVDLYIKDDRNVPAPDLRSCETTRANSIASRSQSLDVRTEWQARTQPRPNFFQAPRLQPIVRQKFHNQGLHDDVKVIASADVIM